MEIAGVHLELRDCPSPRPGHFVLLGDVRDVIYRRAQRLWALPKNLSSGLGLLTAGDASSAGEGILFHHLAGRTPPVPLAGSEVSIEWRPSGWRTPFFLGWQAAPALAGSFRLSADATLKSLYFALFALMARRGWSSPVLFLEAEATAVVAGIADRALAKPVNVGEGSILGENSETMFRLRPIAGSAVDAAARIPVAIVGAGIAPQGHWRREAALEDLAFYQPPGEPPQLSGTPLATHNHALAWAGVAAKPLSRAPSHVVHLDDWSSSLAGDFTAYIPNGEGELHILPAS